MAAPSKAAGITFADFLHDAKSTGCDCDGPGPLCEDCFLKDGARVIDAFAEERVQSFVDACEQKDGGMVPKMIMALEAGKAEAWEKVDHLRALLRDARGTIQRHVKCTCAKRADGTRAGWLKGWNCDQHEALSRLEGEL